MKSTLPRFCIQYIYLYMHTIYIIYIYTVPHKKTHQKTSQKIFYKTKPKCNKSLYVVSQIILPRNHVIIYFNLSSQRIHDNTEAQRSRQSPTAEPPDFQPLTDGLRRRLEARVHRIVLRGTWGEGQRRILQECSVDGEDVASDLGDVKQLLHLPAGPRPTAYRAKDTIALLRRETPSFIGPDLWPANSPDLNPVEFGVYHTTIRNIDELKERLIVVWAELKQSVIDKAIEQWRPRLRACVQAKEHHSEHLIK